MRPPPKAKPQDSYIRGQSISPSTSDNGDLRGISFSDIPGKFKDLPVKDSVSEILEPFAQTIFGTSYKNSQINVIRIPKFSFEILESCESTVRLNLYLKARKDDVSAGVPGKFLHAVSGLLMLFPNC
ncbi:hypothetical protein OIU84_003227 [Salix udensis]|uniref:Uncharacterized protein n=1 Tax=Salix udensis TaxID=889485 RepID=A0AAD6P684_9ROSI|nr:hypothetical protein OIU84_003227 [Salix udensis]